MKSTFWTVQKWSVLGPLLGSLWRQTAGVETEGKIIHTYLSLIRKSSRYARKEQRDDRKHIYTFCMKQPITFFSRLHLTEVLLKYFELNWLSVPLAKEGVGRRGGGSGERGCRVDTIQHFITRELQETYKKKCHKSLNHVNLEARCIYVNSEYY